MIFAQRKRPYPRREPVRPDVPREHRGYICPECDLVMTDGVSYDWCPVCRAQVDWVDARKPVWACPDCDATANDKYPADKPPWCEHCKRVLAQVYRPRKRSRRKRNRGRKETSEPYVSMFDRLSSIVFHPKVTAALFLLSLLPMLLLALDSQLRWSMIGIAAPYILLPVIIGGVLLGQIGASWEELVELSKSRKTRVVHGLEHATLALLQQRGAVVLGGETKTTSFTATFRKDKRWTRREANIRRAVRDAIDEIQNGNTELAYHRKCGTSFLVGALVLSLLAVIAFIIAFFVSLSLTGVVITFAIFAALMTFGVRPLGLAAQRAFTVSTDLKRGRMVKLMRRPAKSRSVKYEVVLDVELAS